MLVWHCSFVDEEFLGFCLIIEIRSSKVRLACQFESWFDIDLVMGIIKNDFLSIFCFFTKSPQLKLN